VQALPSSQGVPSDWVGFEQTPVPGSHAPARWHWSSAEHTTGDPPVHWPPWHWSTAVHLLPSSQLAPSGLLGLEQVPVPGLQVPAVWHWSVAAQTTACPLVHVPLRHWSPVVHLSPSSQLAPSGLLGLEQAPLAGLQVPAV
jgi:hypothetical protein